MVRGVEVPKQNEWIGAGDLDGFTQKGVNLMESVLWRAVYVQYEQAGLSRFSWDHFDECMSYG